jgi:hypothetical protein
MVANTRGSEMDVPSPLHGVIVKKIGANGWK